VIRPKTLGRSKYGATRIKADDGGPDYRSRREATRHHELQLLVRAGQITGLQREVPFVLADGVRITGEQRKRPPIRYVADFVYRDQAGAQVVEDAKGMPTDVYRLKKHLMALVHDIHIREV
jgi:hypothetical protein